MPKELNPEPDTKARIEHLLQEIKKLRELSRQTKDPKAAAVLAGQVEDLQDQVAFLRRRLPDVEAD